MGFPYAVLLLYLSGQNYVCTFLSSSLLPVYHLGQNPRAPVTLKQGDPLSSLATTDMGAYYREGYG
jgi:hypothetical protein